jgi:hypothetical protein
MANKAWEVARSAKARLSRQYLHGRKESPEFKAYSVSLDPRNNVMAVGIGPKLRDGRITDDLSIHIYVEHKIDAHALPKEMRLPTQVDGLPVDVIESGRFLPLLVPPIQRQRLRPAKPGCSVGFRSPGDRQMAGTLGALVESKKEGYILSNNHVLAGGNSLPTGTNIYQPGLADAVDPEPIAELSNYSPLSNSVPNRVDCAIAKVIDPTLVDPIFLPSVGRLASAAPVEPDLGMIVEKVGRTTGYTIGEVFDIDADLAVNFPRLGSLVFENQFMIRGQGDPEILAPS